LVWRVTGIFNVHQQPGIPQPGPHAGELVVDRSPLPAEGAGSPGHGRVGPQGVDQGRQLGREPVGGSRQVERTITVFFGPAWLMAGPGIAVRVDGAHDRGPPAPPLGGQTAAEQAVGLVVQEQSEERPERGLGWVVTAQPRQEGQKQVLFDVLQVLGGEPGLTFE
jgi:hypothetical protein